MIWLTWRQFRFQAAVTLAILAAAAIYVTTTGLTMHHAYAADIAACPHPEIGCRFFLSFQGSYNAEQRLLEMLVLATGVDTSRHTLSVTEPLDTGHCRKDRAVRG